LRDACQVRLEDDQREIVVLLVSVILNVADDVADHLATLWCA